TKNGLQHTKQVKMSMNCRMEPIQREEIIARYLSRSLDEDAVEEFEGHYLGCDECFDELRVSERLAAELASGSNLAWRETGGVAVLQFRSSTELTHSAKELDELRREVLEQSDKRVIIDLGRVTRIDSAGLGQLMSCYSHLVRNQGSLKVLNASPEVRKVMDMTGISTLIPAFTDEREAIRSFGN
ncbi:MAG: STAS domain-containing protein, partial [Acidobacteriota bacterium]|nr:STAS domain-containing protein [Acidobacteriota bacterium]